MCIYFPLYPLRCLQLQVGHALGQRCVAALVTSSVLLMQSESNQALVITTDVNYIYM